MENSVKVLSAALVACVLAICVTDFSKHSLDVTQKCGAQAAQVK